VASRFYPLDTYLEDLALRWRLAVRRHGTGTCPHITGTKLWITGWAGCAGQGRGQFTRHSIMRRQPNNPAGTRHLLLIEQRHPPRRHRSGDNPMTTFRTLLTAAALVGAAASSTAFAASLTVMNQAESFSVQYEAGYMGNIVGGGAVRVLGQGERQQIVHADTRFAPHTAGIPCSLAAPKAIWPTCRPCPLPHRWPHAGPVISLQPDEYPNRRKVALAFRYGPHGARRAGSPRLIWKKRSRDQRRVPGSTATRPFSSIRCDIAPPTVEAARWRSVERDKKATTTDGRELAAEINKEPQCPEETARQALQFPEVRLPWGAVLPLPHTYTKIDISRVLKPFCVR
jgi:hypothetical protein